MSQLKNTRKSLVSANRNGDREDKLKSLALILAKQIDVCDDPKDLAQLSRQYRETLKELDALQSGDEDADDPIVEVRLRHAR